MLEKDIVSAIMRYLKTVPNCFCFKEHGGMYGTAGIPDIVCCIGGRFVAFEVKTAKGKLTTLQSKTLEKIYAAKGAAYKVTTVQEVKDIVGKLTAEEGDDYE